MTHPAPRLEPAKGKVDKTTMLDALKALGEATGVVTGLAFVSGWLYWSTYYAAFGLNPMELEFPIAILSVSPIQVLWVDWYSERDIVAWPMGIGLVILTILMGFFVYLRMGHQRRALLMICVTAIAACAGAFKLGHHDAALDMGCESRLPDVGFVTAGERLTARDSTATCVTDGDLSCKLVLHVNSVYHYFVTPDEEGCAMSSGNVVGNNRVIGEIRDSEVRLLRVQRRTLW